ncbi:Alpha/Beta hydrolase protein [Melanogaster broomeanus]|nr:Alpha/Beta hydrolase protein [Melanogaster broomeanus]
MATTIPYTPSPEWKSVNPRKLLPIHVHPNLQNIETPPLPFPARPPVFHTTHAGTYLRSTHLVPAAFPRLVPDIPLPEIPQYTPGRPAAERLKDLEAVMRELVEKQHKLTQGMLGGGHSVKPGTRLVIALFLAHAGGFPKEDVRSYGKRCFRSLLDSPAGYMVDEVWAWDPVQHGDSALINAHNLSGIFEWLDNSRDIANFLLSYLPEDVETEALPTRLKRLPESTSEARKEHGYCARKMVVVGHCFGGCTSLRAAMDFPKLFSSVILVDPAMVQPYTSIRDCNDIALASFSRRSRWASREDALRLFKKSPFFRTWNPEVLQLYIDHALIDDSNGGVKLKMSSVHEGLCLVGYMASWEMWELLDKVDEAITLRWVVPKEGYMGEEATRVRVWRRPANSSNVIFHFSGHLIVQEAPVELAQEVSRFLLRNYGSTKAHL